MVKSAYFAGGCFWCITPIFKIYGGVDKVVSGYSGGDEENPTYEDVKAQKTGHREAFMLSYNEEEIDYETLVEIYLANVDPFDEGGQFVDRGHSYTLAIYYVDDAQKEIATRMVKELEDRENKKAYIAIEAFKSFYEAEEYHQDYAEKNPEAFEKELIESGRKSQ